MQRISFALLPARLYLLKLCYVQYILNIMYDKFSTNYQLHLKNISFNVDGHKLNKTEKMMKLICLRSI